MVTKSTTMFRQGIKTIPFLIILIMVLGTALSTAMASSGVTKVPGKVYEMGKDSHYEFSESNSYAVTSSNTYGAFSVNGNIVKIDESGGIPTYRVGDGNLDLFYNHGDTLLNADEDSWHLIDDKSKKIDTLTLDTNIMKGAIITQTSTDRMNWVTVDSVTNAFSDTPTRANAIYTTQDVQLINGCYYRVIVAYELRIRTEDSNFLFINTDKYDYKKCVEAYEFYADTASADANSVDPNQTHRLGDTVRVEKHDGYTGEKDIDNKDIHYNWELGNFFVSGYTAKTVDSAGDMVFLKNVGDRVTLWFRLNQSIDALNEKDNLSITADTSGYDQQFQTERMNFGRGVLIIRYTDHNNNKSKPTIYTNYLEANVSVGADTKVHLFEEGDYEVALDYEVTEDNLIDAVGHYRISFTFSVRNGNCMVYPFDVVTKSELTNSSMTPNGFQLDLAKSRYLKVNLKREVLRDSADGLVEDTRFNGPAKDGATYTEEGIYTITVRNEYTDQTTVKKIYVGTNNILKAYMTTGLSIPEINSLVAQGATISDDGTIEYASIEEPPVEPAEPITTPETPESNISAPEESTDPVFATPEQPEIVDAEDTIDETSIPVLPIILAICGVIACIIVFLLLKKRTVWLSTRSNNVKGDDEK